MAKGRRVVVTGLGIASPIGLGLEAFWDSLMEGTCGLRRIESFDPSGLPAHLGGELPPFKLGDFIPKSYRKSAKVMSRDIRVAIVAAYHAVRDAGLNTKCLTDRGEADGSPNVDSTRFGANIGAGLVGTDLQELGGALNMAANADQSLDLRAWGEEGMGHLTPLWLLKFLPNMLACHLTIVHDAQAPSNTITCGEASSHLAIGEAFRTIARGDADVYLCGGAECKTHPMGVIRPLLWGYLNTTANDNPERACRPFAHDAQGTVVAEGGGLVILEDLDHARQRKARIYAEVIGFGASISSYHWSKPDPQGEAASLALRHALKDGGVTANDIDLAAPFGTGIREYDAGEGAGWVRALGDRLTTIPAQTTRGSVGINGAGSGAMDFAAAVAAVHRNTIPPSVNADQVGDDCPFRLVRNDPIDADVTHAITLGYALAGGQHAALVIRRYKE